VSEQILIGQLEDQCNVRVIGKEILALCDTSAINVESHYNRIKDEQGLGPIEKGLNSSTLGFLIHPVFAIDAHDSTAYGIAAIQLWNREKTPKRSRKCRSESQKDEIVIKESMKWIRPCQQSMEYTLAEAKHVTFVMDREGDIIEVFDRLPNEKVDLVVRCRHNRIIKDTKGEKKKLVDFVGEQEVQGTSVVRIHNGHPKRKARDVEVQLKYGQFLMPWPRKKTTRYRKHPQGVPINFVQIKEVQQTGHIDEPPLEWLILTSKEVNCVEQALKIISIYEKRWKIEVYFKHLKSDGFDIESTQLTKGKSIRKLILLVMQAALKVEQLKAARNGEGEIRVEDVFQPQEIACLEKLNQRVSGKTKIQQNPYPPDHLSWASWIIARLGGWTGYNKTRPPGTKTFIHGLQQFEAITIGFQINRS